MWNMISALFEGLLLNVKVALRNALQVIAPGPFPLIPAVKWPYQSIVKNSLLLFSS